MDSIVWELNIDKTRKTNMPLLILGDLYVSQEQDQRLKNLIGSYKQFLKADKIETIEKAILESSYIFCCNFDLNKYISKLKSISLIVMAETGIVNINVEKAKKTGLKITNLKSYSNDAVCQYILFCVLQGIRPWKKFFSADFDRKQLLSCPSRGLETLKVGIIGYGAIGHGVSSLLEPYGCRISANANHIFTNNHVLFEDKETIFRSSDIIVVTCSLNETSKGFINKKLLDSMKPNSIIISISQRDVFKEQDLYEFLKKREDVQAYLDFDLKASDKIIMNLMNVHLSHHVAFYTHQTILNRTTQCIDILAEKLNSQYITNKKSGEVG